MKEEFYYSKLRLVLYAGICTVLALFLISIFIAAMSAIKNATMYVLAFIAIVIYIAASLFSKFLKLFCGKTPAIAILDDLVVLQGIRNEDIPFSSIHRVKLVRPSGPDGTVGFYALHFDLHSRVENGQHKYPIVTMPLALINVNRNRLLSLIEQRMAVRSRSLGNSAKPRKLIDNKLASASTK